MRSLLCILVLAACTEHGRGGGDDDTAPDPDLTDPDHPPDGCGCVQDDPPPISSGSCCASTVCSFDEEAGQWLITICDEVPAVGAPS
jgi:hypothetical protein